MVGEATCGLPGTDWACTDPPRRVPPPLAGNTLEKALTPGTAVVEACNRKIRAAKAAADVSANGDLPRVART